MSGALTVTLSILAWKNLMTIEEAKKIHRKLANKIPPETIEEIVEELKKTAKVKSLKKK